MKTLPGFIIAASLLFTAASTNSVLAQDDGGATLTISGGGGTFSSSTSTVDGGLTITRINSGLNLLRLGTNGNTNLAALPVDLWPTIFGSPGTGSGGSSGGTLNLGLPQGGPLTILPYQGGLNLGSTTLTLGGATTSGGTLTINPIITTGLTLSLANTYTGATTITGGTLVLNGNSNVIAGVVQINGTILQTTGSGVLTLTGTNTYTGVTTISAGTLQLGNAIVGGLSGTELNAVAGSGVLTLNLGSGSTFSNNLVLTGATENLEMSSETIAPTTQSGSGSDPIFLANTPEPSSALLLALGFAVPLWRARKRLLRA